MTVAKLQDREGVKKKDIAPTFSRRDFVIKFFNRPTKKVESYGGVTFAYRNVRNCLIRDLTNRFAT